MKTVVALLDTFDDAQNVMDELTSIGIKRDTIKIANEMKGEFAYQSGDDFESGNSGMQLISG